MQPHERMSRSERRAAERALRDEARRTEQERLLGEWQEAGFRASPVGQAVTARERGDGFLQLRLDVRENLHTAGTGPVQGRSGDVVDQQPYEGETDVLSAVEAVGWRLEDVGYVFVPPGSVSQNKLPPEDAETGVVGKVIGIYLFRAAPPGPGTVDGPYRHG